MSSRASWSPLNHQQRVREDQPRVLGLTQRDDLSAILEALQDSGWIKGGATEQLDSA